MKIRLEFSASKQDAYPTVVNAPTEAEIQLLTDVIRERVPFPTNGSSQLADIIRIERHQCPCCYPVLEALVRVSAGGLYEVRIGPKGMGSGPSEVSVTELSLAKTPLFKEVLKTHPVTAPLSGSAKGRYEWGEIND